MANGALSEGGGRGSAVGLHFSDDTSLSARNPRAPNAYAKRPPPGEVTEDGGCCPPWDGTGSPTVAQEIPWQNVGTGDGSTTAFVFPFDYVPTTLRVMVAGLGAAGHISEDDSTTGDFSLDFAPTTGQVVQAKAFKGPL